MGASMKIDGIVTALITLEKALDAGGLAHHVAVAIDQPRWRDFVSAASRYLKPAEQEVATTSDMIVIKGVAFYCWRGGTDPIARQIRHLEDLQRSLASIRS